MTIVEACETVLRQAGRPMSTDEMYDAIIAGGHFTFKSKDPKAILGGAIRKHLRASRAPRIKEMQKGLYAVTD